MANEGGEGAARGDPPEAPLMPDEDLQEVGAELHKVLDEVLTETTAGWAQLACELAQALREVAPDHPLFERAEVQRVLELEQSES